MLFLLRRALSFSPLARKGENRSGLYPANEVLGLGNFRFLAQHPILLTIGNLRFGTRGRREAFFSGSIFGSISESLGLSSFFLLLYFESSESGKSSHFLRPGFFFSCSSIRIGRLALDSTTTTSGKTKVALKKRHKTLASQIYIRLVRQ